VLGDRVLERGLEAATGVDDEPGVVHELHVLRRELEVVRLSARRGQVDHVELVAPHVLGSPGERIEARDHSRGPGALAGAAADREDGDEEENDDAHGGDASTPMRTGIIIAP
jgi:hypothetical protein